MNNNNKVEYKVLVNYELNGVSVSRSLYSGPYRSKADQAYRDATTLAQHGILVNCKIRFFDGYKLNQAFEKEAATLAAEYPAIKKDLDGWYQGSKSVEVK